MADKTQRADPGKTAGKTAPQRDKPWLIRTYSGH